MPCCPTRWFPGSNGNLSRSEEHTSELQSHSDLVCRLLLEKKKKKAEDQAHSELDQRLWVNQKTRTAEATQASPAVARSHNRIGVAYSGIRIVRTCTNSGK